MRVEPQTADKILGIIRVADIDPGAIENAQRIVEFIAPKASPGLDSNIPFLNKLGVAELRVIKPRIPGELEVDRKSTRLNSSHSQISYAVFCLKKKKKKAQQQHTIRD